MRGGLTIKAGTYRLNDAINLRLSLSDEGVVVRLDDCSVGKANTAIIDEHGTVVRLIAHEGAEIRKVSPARLAIPPAPAPPQRPSPPNKANTIFTSIRHPTDAEQRTAESASPKLKKSKRIRFVIQYCKKYRPRSRAFILGGFMDGWHIHVLYRVASAGIIYYEDQLLIAGETAVRGKAIRKDQQLPRSEWDAFLAMPEHTTFKFAEGSTCWRKMSGHEFRMILEGRVLKLNEGGLLI